MNFHISPLSPLRPRYSASLGPNPPGRPEQHHQYHRQQPDHNGSTDHHHHHHAHTTPTATAATTTTTTTTTTVGPGPLSHPKIEVEGAEADDEMAASTTGSSSGSSSGSGSDISADDVTQDSRDVLVQRLNDLAQRVSAADVRAEDVGALHAQVDAMERMLSRGSRARSASRHSSSGVRRRASSSLRPGAGSGPRRRSVVLLPGGGSGDALGLMGPPLSPSWLMSQFQRRPSVPRVLGERGLGYRNGADDVDQTSELHKARPVVLLPTHLHPSSVEQPEPVAAAAAAAATDATSGDGSPQISSEMADRIVEEAEGLCAEMASVIESLQKRREESDHLHAVLIQREGAADKLILEQAGRIGELEDTVAEDESELRYLKIQLRGIEAQCMGYIPKGADPELDLSIRNWKKDWTSLRDRWAARRATSFASGDESSTFSNSASPSAG